MKINAYLAFDGNCREAFTFYQKVLGGQIVAMMTPEGSPMADQVPPEYVNKIMHARLVAGDSVIMGSDAMCTPSKPAGFSVAINLDDVEEARRIFEGISEGGTVSMPFGETFWSNGFGMCKDRYDIDWMVNCSKPMP